MKKRVPTFYPTGPSNRWHTGLRSNRIIPARPRTPEPTFYLQGQEPTNLRPRPIAEGDRPPPRLHPAVEEEVSPEEEAVLLADPPGESPAPPSLTPQSHDEEEAALLAEPEEDPSTSQPPASQPQDDEEDARQRQAEDQLLSGIREQIAGRRTRTPPPQRGGMRSGVKPCKRNRPRNRHRNKSGRTTAPLDPSSEEEEIARHLRRGDPANTDGS